MVTKSIAMETPSVTVLWLNPLLEPARLGGEEGKKTELGRVRQELTWRQ